MVYYHLPPPPPPPSPPPRYNVHEDLGSHSDDSNAIYRRVTIHGLSDLHRANNIYLRWFWVATFFGALAAAVYGCYQIVELYIESPIVVSYFVQEFNSSFPLPDLVICPFNRFNAEFLKNYSIPDDVAQYMQLTFGASAKHPNQRRELMKYFNATLMAQLDISMNITLMRLNMTFGDFLEAASLRCSDIFDDCFMPTGNVKCCDYATSMMTFAGKCYRIRGVDQMGPGYGYGMSVVVSLPKKLYSLAINNWLNDGIVVKLAEPNSGVDYDLTFVPVGTHALMPLKATKYEFMHDPPSFECIQEASPNYSRVDCFDACFIETAQNRCKCTIVTNFKKDSRPACTTYQYYFCIYAVLSEQFRANNDMETYFYDCRQRCKPRCTYWQYQTSISYSKFPSEEARAFARSQEEWRRMQNTIILDVYYEKLEFTRIKHYRGMTLHAFIANLGGQLSLWLGASTLTLIQLIVLMLEYCYGKCRRLWYARFSSKAVRPNVKLVSPNKLGHSHTADPVIIGGRQMIQTPTPTMSPSDGKPKPRGGILRSSSSNNAAARFAKSLDKSPFDGKYDRFSDGALGRPSRTISADSATLASGIPSPAPPPPPPAQPPTAAASLAWNLKLKAQALRKSKTIANCASY